MSTPVPAKGRATDPPPYRPAAGTGQLPPLTGGQRASAILAGLSGHILFAIGWFGIAFVILGTIFSPLINDLLANLLGDVDAQRFTEILQRAGAAFWMIGLVYFVGSIAFVVFGILSSLLILRRGGVHRPGRVNWTAFLVAAVIDLPIFLIVLWATTAITDASSAMLWLPPLLSLVLAAAIGIGIWWLMAHLARGRGATESPAPTP